MMEKEIELGVTRYATNPGGESCEKAANSLW
jgi:hypothetical protein